MLYTIAMVGCDMILLNIPTWAQSPSLWEKQQQALNHEKAISTHRRYIG